MYPYILHVVDFNLARRSVYDAGTISKLLVNLIREGNNNIQYEKCTRVNQKLSLVQLNFFKETRNHSELVR